jgi:hypothetical protein
MVYDYMRKKVFKQQDFTPYHGVNKLFLLQPSVNLWNSEVDNIMGETIKWPHPETNVIAKSLDYIDDLWDWIIPPISDKLLLAHIHRLRATLLWWDVNCPTKIISPIEIMDRTLREGPAFADYLSDTLDYSLRNKLGTCCLYSAQWDPDNVEEIKTINDLFSPFHLIPFKREEKDDIKLFLCKPPEINANLDAFKNCVKKYLKQVDKLPVLDTFDVLQLMRSSKTFDKGKKKTRTEALISRDLNLYKPNKLTYKYVHVYKNPHESRACVELDFDSLYLLKLAQKQLEAINKAPNDAFRIKDLDFLDSWLTCSSSEWCYMSDMKKAGLTFPRPLLFATLDALYEEYPDSVFAELKEAIINSTIFIGEEEYLTQNGIGLGVLNEFVSFSMAILVLRFLEETGYEISSLIYNDDQVLKFRTNDFFDGSISSQIDAGQDWDKFMKDHGCVIHAKKPFWSKTGQFLEVYGKYPYHFNTTKWTQYVGNLFWALMSPNIYEAKKLTSSIYDNMPDLYRPRTKEALEIIISKWGFEFSPHESKYSFPIGWVTNRNINGQSLILHELYRIHENWIELGFFNVLNVKEPRRPNKKLKDLAKKQDGMSQILRSTKQNMSEYDRFVESFKFLNRELNPKQVIKLSFEVLKLRSIAYARKTIEWPDINHYLDLLKDNISLEPILDQMIEIPRLQIEFSEPLTLKEQAFTAYKNGAFNLYMEETSNCNLKTINSKIIKAYQGNALNLLGRIDPKQLELFLDKEPITVYGNLLANSSSLFDRQDDILFPGNKLFSKKHLDSLLRDYPVDQIAYVISRLTTEEEIKFFFLEFGSELIYNSEPEYQEEVELPPQDTRYARYLIEGVWNSILEQSANREHLIRDPEEVALSPGATNDYFEAGSFDGFSSEGENPFNMFGDE